jgi:DNA-directed RNA polymerase specialized sigma24 family protein
LFPEQASSFRSSASSLVYSDIAAVLGAPEGSVKGWMKRAKQDLRKELA